MNRIPISVSVQQVARQVLAEIASTISHESSVRSIAATAIQLLAQHGATETWYYDCPAFVLLGTRSCLSISGRDYQPSCELVGTNNLVTIDLSPMIDGNWGDCARSYVVEDGRVVARPTLPEFQVGIEAQRELHAAMQQFATPDTQFCELYRFANEEMEAMGFENLDFMGNVGHSIANRLEERIFIDSDSTMTLGSVSCFTFEPHIRESGGRWGFKHEDVYYFDDHGRANVL